MTKTETNFEILYKFAQFTALQEMGLVKEHKEVKRFMEWNITNFSLMFKLQSRVSELLIKSRTNDKD